MKTNLELVKYVKTKLGFPYVFGFNGQVVTEALIQSKAKMYPNIYDATYIAKARKFIGKNAFDCSGLIDSFLGVDKSASMYYMQATDRGGQWNMTNTPGALVFKHDAAGNIYHVGVCIGNGQAIEARGIDYGVVQTNIADRGWQLWCKSPLISYVVPVTIKTPTGLIKFGMTGSAVKWLQMKLNEHGYRLVVDSIFGKNTLAAVDDFQKKHGLVVDGIVGDKTKAKLIA